MLRVRARGWRETMFAYRPGGSLPRERIYNPRTRGGLAPAPHFSTARCCTVRFAESNWGHVGTLTRVFTPPPALIIARHKRPLALPIGRFLRFPAVFVHIIRSGFAFRTVFLIRYIQKTILVLDSLQLVAVFDVCPHSILCTIRGSARHATERSSMPVQ